MEWDATEDQVRLGPDSTTVGPKIATLFRLAAAAREGVLTVSVTAARSRPRDHPSAAGQHGAGRGLAPARPRTPRDVRSGPAGALHSLQRTIGNRATSRLVQLSRAGRSGALDRPSSALADGVTRGKGAGRPLDERTRGTMEARFGAPFGDVRVHTDLHAAQSASELGALAYTVGRDVFFGTGRYQPAQREGRRLLAHELTHVLQQASRSGSIRPGLSSRGDPAEQQAEQVADRLTVGASPVGALGPTSPASIQRAEPEPADETPRAPVELPPPEGVSPDTLELAERTAEEIDDVVASRWDDVRFGAGLDALLLANAVEDILGDTFEMGHADVPQLGEADAPVLQYYVAQHPGLRDRLAVLRERAGAQNTQRIGKYLGISLSDVRRFNYEIHMMGMSGGEGVDVARARVTIRYLEDGKIGWTSGYEFFAVGQGIGLPLGVSGDIGWDAFTATEYWEPDDFEGRMLITAASAGLVIGYEIEGAIFYGYGQHRPVEADIGGWIWGVEGGAGAVDGLLHRISGPAVPPPPPPAPVPPRFVQPIPVHDQLIVGFDTNDDKLDNPELRMLADFVERNRDVFAGGDYRLQLIGNASRAGDPVDNLKLSRRRIDEVLVVIDSLLRARESSLDPDRVDDEARGEQQAERAGKPKTDDSAEDRTVEIALNGTIHREITPP
jgi:outer membrane protein OmpA-like peptidoglycan-associated protein